MVRRVLVVLVLVLASVLVGAPPGSVSAADAFSGTVVDSRTGTALAGVTVLVGDTNGRPIRGLRAVTSGTGRFVIGGLDGEEYSLIVNGRSIDYEAGYLGMLGSQPHGRPVVEWYGNAVTWAPAGLGRIGLDRRFFTGRVVDAHTGDPVAGVEVMATDTDGVPLLGTTAVTTVSGTFRLAGGLGEEHGVWLDGSEVAYEIGYLGQIGTQPVGRPVVSTWEDATTWTPSHLGRVGIEALPRPGTITTARLRSPAPRAITLSVVAPTTGGAPSSYQVRCTVGRVTVTRSYVATGTTRTGFVSGANSCGVRAVNSTGAGPWALRVVTVR
jgi:hypothetical protein